ncbi:uncharacterized protein F5147DRAFT_257828 [Suillus discolor]|uniref:F-box domain-containing protein n=1 Tax=Suillus discolor TaxID=1912936 RepID=A0A9P7FIZ2_9AGAM|nr:uncharacterized protein F5147DRAFT_257828 [Suillus discolor]KAG2118118.1 hypothetical protein F5147DRAFT_257828 [Suillus discolor]
MESPSSCLRVTRLTLIHAVLAYVSPELTTMSCLPLMLPIEIRFRILTHLHLALSASLLGSLNRSLQSALDDLCDSCKAYNLHVYGPNVSDWPEIRVTGGCWCAKIGGHQRPEIARARDRWNSDACVDAKIRSPLADHDPPPYFIFHLRQVAATYLSTTSSSLFTREIEAMVTSHAGAKEVDALVWKVLRHFQCCVASSKTRAWKLEDELCIIPISERPSEGSSDDEILCTLQLALDLNRHRDFVSHSELNPRNMMLTPPLISNSPDSKRLYSNPRSRNISLICGVAVACVLFSIRYGSLAAW